ncbi:hypothetical protein QH494_06140 [Sphingomonas sp. AR_OL41]|uniref:hypothetical protein n=1 Tax=Sphingomonas sp. AR_OL41 TaxID=3042729 RepID=UPI00247FF0A4|nr:hypothetical protein [Sphingomonas sp. AR_OL41]MDH7971758.1 hypothetical protein [Sphingomonas sp. AR_OL41]
MNAIRPIRRPSEQMQELAQVIGQPNVLALCKVLGGTKVYIPAKIIATHPIAQAIGMRAAAILAEHYHGTQIDLPKAHHRRQAVIELAKSGEMTIAQAALACDYTERHVYRLIQPEDDGQGSLFDLLS